MLISDKIVLAQSMRESGVAKQQTSFPLDAHPPRVVATRASRRRARTGFSPVSPHIEIYIIL